MSGNKPGEEVSKTGRATGLIGNDIQGTGKKATRTVVIMEVVNHSHVCIRIVASVRGSRCFRKRKPPCSLLQPQALPILIHSDDDLGAKRDIQDTPSSEAVPII